jgi:hypothetical protein
MISSDRRPDVMPKSAARTPNSQRGSRLPAGTTNPAGVRLQILSRLEPYREATAPLAVEFVFTVIDTNVGFGVNLRLHENG